MDLKLKDKVIIVTGGAKGIGAGIVWQLAREGAIPVIIGRNEQDNLILVEALQAQGLLSHQFSAELTIPEEINKTIQAIVLQFGRIDGLVNNAGVNDNVGLENGTYMGFMESLHKNLVHYYLMAQGCLPYLKTSKGAIVNIGSKVADTGQGGTSAYAASNGGRNALTREWAVELLPYGIRVNAVIVAECFTPLYKQWISTFPDADQRLDRILSKIPLENRMTEASEIADTVAFLLSERSSHTTGQLLYVDGGYVHLDRGITP